MRINKYNTIHFALKGIEICKNSLVKLIKPSKSCGVDLFFGRTDICTDTQSDSMSITNE